MPEPNFFERCHSGQYQFKVPFIIYADFEAILQILEEDENELDPEAADMRKISCHISSGFCRYTIFAYGCMERLIIPYSSIEAKIVWKSFEITLGSSARDSTTCSPQSQWNP